MPSTARLTNALRGHGKTLATASAAAAALVGIGAGAASAATVPAGPATIPAAAASAHAISSVAQSAARSYAATLGQTAHARQVTTVADVRHAPAGHARSRTRHAAAPARTRARAEHASHRAAVDHRRGAAAPTRPYEIYDSVTPSAIPAGHEIATYATGPYAANPAQLTGKKVLWIDTNTTDPNANALDVEPGDATPTQAATWAAQRLHAHPHSQAIIYTMRSDWAAAEAAVGTLPHWMQAQVRWWIADPTGVPHVVPGADATQWYWGTNYDITMATPRL